MGLAALAAFVAWALITVAAFARLTSKSRACAVSSYTAVALTLVVSLSPLAPNQLAVTLLVGAVLMGGALALRGNELKFAWELSEEPAQQDLTRWVLDVLPLLLVLVLLGALILMVT